MPRGFGADAEPWTVLATLLLDRTRIAARLAASADVIDRGRCIALWQFLNFVRAQPSGRGNQSCGLLDGVRRLVRLGDERDLRQLPAAAQGIDAVRLMTIHGAKGLEFPRGSCARHERRYAAADYPARRRAPRPTAWSRALRVARLTSSARGRPKSRNASSTLPCPARATACSSTARRKRLTGRPCRNSPFLCRMGAGLARVQVIPSRALPEAP